MWRKRVPLGSTHVISTFDPAAATAAGAGPAGTGAGAAGAFGDVAAGTAAVCGDACGAGDGKTGASPQR